MEVCKAVGLIAGGATEVEAPISIKVVVVIATGRALEVGKGVRMGT